MLENPILFYFYSRSSARLHCFIFHVSVIDVIIIILNIFESIFNFSGKGVSDPCSLNPDPDPGVMVNPDPDPDKQFLWETLKKIYKWEKFLDQTPAIYVLNRYKGRGGGGQFWACPDRYPMTQLIPGPAELEL